MKIVLTYGTFDYFHYGHYNFLKQAKAAGDYLIVGVSTDELCLKKGKQTILDENKRFEIISSLKFVDKVIFETDFNQKLEDIKKYNVDILFEGEDYKDILVQSAIYNELKDKCKIVFGHRTKGVSTTELKEKLSEQVKLDLEETNSLHSKTNTIRKEKF